MLVRMAASSTVELGHNAEVSTLDHRFRAEVSDN